jgi:hypothetical protein
VSGMKDERCDKSPARQLTELQRNALDESDGVCASCERDFGALLPRGGWAALEVHHLDSVGSCEKAFAGSQFDQPVVVCGACHNLLHSDQAPTMQELRYAFRPRCPYCDAQRTKAILWGMPARMPRFDDVILMGCIVFDELPADWRCGECETEWSDAGNVDPYNRPRSVIRTANSGPRCPGGRKTMAVEVGFELPSRVSRQAARGEYDGLPDPFCGWVSGLGSCCGGLRSLRRHRHVSGKPDQRKQDPTDLWAQPTVGQTMRRPSAS